VADQPNKTFILDNQDPYTLVPFQDEDLGWLKAHPKSMVLYDRGLGKTVLATKRNIDAGVGTHAVFCPKNAIQTWKTHTQEWWSHFYPRADIDIWEVDGSPDCRRRMWRELAHPARTRQHRLFIVGYGSGQRDAQWLREQKYLNRVDQIDLDEAQRLRNRNSVAFKRLQPILRQHPYFSFESGTPVSRGAQEFWTYLNCIDPKLFSSYWKFAGTFCELFAGRWGTEIIGPRNAEEFGRLLKQYARIRTAEDPGIAEQLPQKSRNPLYVELDDDQYKVYKDLGADKFSWTETGRLILAGNSMEATIRFRQLLVCPKILDPTLSLGAAFTDFLQNFDDWSPEERHTVIFSPFTGAFPHFRKALEDKGVPVFQLSGGISSDEQQRQIRLWRENKGVMLNSIRYAESYSLEPARTAYFIGYEWDPNMNLQAEDRLRRLTTRYNLAMYYYRYAGTVDDDMCYTVNWKHVNITQIMRSQQGE
jgi:SNF2 family DNA or RNA helicase